MLERGTTLMPPDTSRVSIPAAQGPRPPAFAVLHRDGLGWARSPRLAALHAAVHSPSGRQPSTIVR